MKILDFDKFSSYKSTIFTKLSYILAETIAIPVPI